MVTPTLVVFSPNLLEIGVVHPEFGVDMPPPRRNFFFAVNALRHRIEIDVKSFWLESIRTFLDIVPTPQMLQLGQKLIMDIAKVHAHHVQTMNDHWMEHQSSDANFSPSQTIRP